VNLLERWPVWPQPRPTSQQLKGRLTLCLTCPLGALKTLRLENHFLSVLSWSGLATRAVDVTSDIHLTAETKFHQGWRDGGRSSSWKHQVTLQCFSDWRCSRGEGSHVAFQGAHVAWSHLR
jgi:hypothetical protein